ncbi:MAG: metallophosphoesterase [Treponema sp.]|jgi:Icc-related predicted phosphoesterase|nr:metallophosphoesterase [Treponema sp.]
MKILCISDQIDPLVYSAAIKERFAGIDLILCAGDLPMDYLDFIVSSLNKPLLFVLGNHHVEERYITGKIHSWDDVIRDFHSSGSVHVGSKIKIEEGLIVAGLGGSMRYNRGPNQFTDCGMYFEILRLIPRLLWNRAVHGRYVDILLTHAPPKGIHDKQDKCHWGFRAFLWFMKVFKPQYLVHGHVHLYDLSDVRSTPYAQTEVINAYSHYIIDTSRHSEAVVPNFKKGIKNERSRSQTKGRI